MLSFPYAFRHLGWLAALVAVAGIAAAEGFTLYVVARFAEYTKQRSYAALVGLDAGWPRGPPASGPELLDIAPVRCACGPHTSRTRPPAPPQVHTMLGRWFSLLMCAVMIAYPFGSCIAYLVITGACGRRRRRCPAPLLRGCLEAHLHCCLMAAAAATAALTLAPHPLHPMQATVFSPC